MAKQNVGHQRGPISCGETKRWPSERTNQLWRNKTLAIREDQSAVAKQNVGHLTCALNSGVSPRPPPPPPPPPLPTPKLVSPSYHFTILYSGLGSKPAKCSKERLLYLHNTKLRQYKASVKTPLFFFFLFLLLSLSLSLSHTHTHTRTHNPCQIKFSSPSSPL